jgi:hypothetical protein
MNGSLSLIGSLAGVSIQSNITRSGDGQIAHEVPLPAAIAGVVTTRTSNVAATLTLAAGHGLAVGDIIDVYWAGGRRYNVRVDTVTGNDVAFDDTPTAAGDNLPAQAAAIAVGKQVAIDTNFDGDQVVLILASAERRCNFSFEDVGNAILAARELQANEPWYWANGQGVTNPLAGNPVDEVKVSNGDSSGGTTFKLAVLYDSTP